MKTGDVVTDGRYTYRILSVESVYGIPAADLIRLRKNGTDTVQVRRRPKNLPLSCLTVIPQGKSLIEIL